MNHEQSCGAIIFLDKDKERLFFVLQHKGGHWDLPKGHVERGESEEQTAIREVKEETDLDIEIIAGYREQIAYSPGKGVQKTVTFFTARALSDKVKLQDKEVKDFRWLAEEEAIKLLTFDAAKRLLGKAVKFLQS